MNLGMALCLIKTCFIENDREPKKGLSCRLRFNLQSEKRGLCLLCCNYTCQVLDWRKIG